MLYLRLLRAHQWVKNVFVFAPLLFGQRMLDPTSVLLTLVGFVCLCLVSSAVYVINDIHDRQEDQMHPRKRLRPIASGAITINAAAGLACVLLIAGVGSSWSLNRGFGLVATVYLLLQIAYTFAFKHMVILDVIAIGLGFVLRAISGAVLIGVEISHWLVICTFTLCLFLGFSKRRCELNVLAAEANADAGRHRRTLSLYTRDLVNHMTTLTAGIAIVTFMLYTVNDRTVEVFGTRDLVYTVPIVVYAIFRFTLLVEHGEVDGPTDVVLRDRPFQAAIVVWLIAALGIVYFGPQMHGFLRALIRPAA